MGNSQIFKNEMDFNFSAFAFLDQYFPKSKIRSFHFSFFLNLYFFTRAILAILYLDLDVKFKCIGSVM